LKKNSFLKNLKTKHPKIGELAVARENFIADELKKRAEAGEEIDDFGSSVNQSIEKRAKSNGFVKEANNPE
jgi:hypothetical protein